MAGKELADKWNGERGGGRARVQSPESPRVRMLIAELSMHMHESVQYEYLSCTVISFVWSRLRARTLHLK